MALNSYTERVCPDGGLSSMRRTACTLSIGRAEGGIPCPYSVRRAAYTLSIDRAEGGYSLSIRESLGMALNASIRESLGMALNSHAERVCPDGGLSPCGGRFFPVHQRKPRDGFKLARREGLPRWRTITVRRAVFPCPSEKPRDGIKLAPSERGSAQMAPHMDFNVRQREGMPGRRLDHGGVPPYAEYDLLCAETC
jgi:hypothetical protein